MYEKLLQLEPQKAIFLAHQIDKHFQIVIPSVGKDTGYTRIQGKTLYELMVGT